MLRTGYCILPEKEGRRNLGDWLLHLIRGGKKEELWELVTVSRQRGGGREKEAQAPVGICRASLGCIWTCAFAVALSSVSHCPLLLKQAILGHTASFLR
ncbi:hypothetical protein E2C01_089976 [Portunus trituberculatus]|uniref:Uncharacterized protein n=1 Tax=Portunus trituberculatus TaxID=210409 RepID=A0A5B7JDG6_PORTR|nr:hypothetical protein [Portunus trituberculatus]